MGIERGAAAPSLVLRKARLMTQLLTAIARLVPGEQGQDLIEYGLLVALIALVAMGAVMTVGQTIFTVFWNGIGQAI
jgi:Flp pilus assembly pilin Flp